MENVATRILPVALAKISSTHRGRRASEPVDAAPIRVMLSERSAQHALRAQFREPVKVEGLAVKRRLVDLDSPVCRITPAGV